VPKSSSLIFSISLFSIHQTINTQSIKQPRAQLQPITVPFISSAPPSSPDSTVAAPIQLQPTSLHPDPISDSPKLLHVAALNTTAHRCLLAPCSTSLLRRCPRVLSPPPLLLCPSSPCSPFSLQLRRCRSPHSILTSLTPHLFSDSPHLPN
jgi:hypothetical protein